MTLAKKDQLTHDQQYRFLKIENYDSQKEGLDVTDELSKMLSDEISKSIDKEILRSLGLEPDRNKRRMNSINKIFKDVE